MAEFLILKQAHWATVDDVTPDGGRFPIAKFNARQMPGDIVDVKDNGFYRVEALGEGIHGWNRTVFNLVRVPKIEVATVIHFASALMDTPDPLHPTRKYKWRFQVPTFSDLPWVKNMVTINGVQFEECYLNISNVNQFHNKVVEKVAV